MVLTYTASENEDGRTVYSIVRREFKVSSALLRRLKAALAISVSGAPVFTDYRLSPGETVTVDIAAAEQPCDNIPEHGSLEVLFENEGLIAVNKPAGLIVHPSRSRNSGTLANFVAGYLETRGETQGGGSEAPPRAPPQAPPRERGGAISLCSCHAVNRLDRDTSGVVLFAKNSYMKALASEALAGKEAVKEYLALVFGAMPESGVIDAPIHRFEERNMLRVVSPEGQRAVTRYETTRVVGAGNGQVSSVLLRLETGRTHQIRVHCLHIGRPVLGDKLYYTAGSNSLSQSLGVETQALHAYRLCFKAPLTGEYLEITAPAPDIFKLENV